MGKGLHPFGPNVPPRSGKDNASGRRDLEPIERLARGEFAKSDFLELLMVLQISEWVQHHNPAWADLDVRQQSDALKEALLSLFARRRCKGVWAAGSELPTLREAVLSLVVWLARVPEAVVAQADHALRLGHAHQSKAAEGQRVTFARCFTTEVDGGDLLALMAELLTDLDSNEAVLLVLPWSQLFRGLLSSGRRQSPRQFRSPRGGHCYPGISRAEW